MLKKNGIDDIAISTNNPVFEYLGVELLHHKNNYTHDAKGKQKNSENSWLNAYYPTEESACYLHGDVYWTENAIKNIINAKVKDTMFICAPDIQDGRKNLSIKGREPLGYIVNNQKVFRKAINDLLDMIDEGKFKNGVDPISWHLYRYINGLELGFNAKDYGFANSIFNTKGDYLVIDDITTDIDLARNIPKQEKLIKFMKGGLSMVKVRATDTFNISAEKFRQFKNIERVGVEEENKIFAGDVFESTEDMAKYLGGENAYGKAFVEVVEIIPAIEEKLPEEKPLPEKEAEKVEEKPIRKTRRKTIAKKED